MIKDLMRDIRLQEIGKIKIGRKGEKRTSEQGKEWRLPEKYDHFVITTNKRDANGDLVHDTEIHKQVGLEPKSLSIRLLYDDIDLNFFTTYTYYVGKKCVCSGDGEVAQRKFSDGSIKPVKCNYEECEYSKGRKCKPFGRLQVILEQTHIVGGVHVYRTTGWNSCQNIISSLRLIQSITSGMLAGLPLQMTINPKTVVPQDTGKITTIYAVNIIFSGSPQKLLDTTIQISRQRMVSGVQLKEIQEAARVGGLLKSSFEETEQEIQDITDEFYPDNGQEIEAEVVESKQPSTVTKAVTEIPDNGGNDPDANGKNNKGNNRKNNPAKRELEESVDIFEGMNVL